MKKKKWMNFLLAFIFIVGVGFLFYPTISNLWNRHMDEKLSHEYVASVGKLDDGEIQNELAKAIKYNENHNVNTLEKDVFDLSDVETDLQYENILNPSKNGIMGRLEIPKIDIDLPVYHGCHPENLAVGVGHVEGTSLPVGGVGTHSVLSAHRGLAQRKLFTDLDQIDEGDIFMMHVLNEVLYYKVDQIKTVLPQELNDVKIDENEDYMTLITCTPFAVNTHRLLVRGKRCDKPVEEEIHQNVNHSDQKKISMQSKLLLYSLLFFVIVMVLQSIYYKKKDKKKGTE